MIFWLACSPSPSTEHINDNPIDKEIIIPAGTYQIGAPEDTSVPHSIRRNVTLTYDFTIQQTELTYAQWLEVTPELPNQYCDKSLPPHPMSPSHPVRCVSWCDAVVFANQKSLHDGYLPAYQMTDTFTATVDVIYCNEQAQFVQINHNANGWRLPTEAEWEIAATDSTNIDEQGWYQNNANGHPHPVSQFEANKWGLYDMKGNVFEWIWERFGDYELTAVTDPFHFEVPLVEVYTRPIKGGSFLSSKEALAPYNRPNASPSLRHPAIGFRLVRTHQPISH
jgi:sulfatase modifying factor 1